MFKPGEKTAYTGLEGYPWNNELIGYYLANMAAVISLMPDPPAKVLDVGCGPGFTSHFLAMRGHNVTGLDVNSDVLALARARTSDRGSMQFFEHDYEEVFCTEEMDAVLFHDSLHHGVRQEFALRAAFTALKPGGTCVVCEPGVGHSWSPYAQKFAREHDVTEKSTPPYNVAKLGRAVGFKVKSVHPHFGTLQKTLFKPDPVTSLPHWIMNRLRFSSFSHLAGKWLHGIIVLTKPSDN